MNSVQQNGPGGWVRFSSVIDSGSAENVMPLAAAGHLPIQSSTGSANGQVYYGADGSVIPNKGQKTVTMYTEEMGSELKATYQVAPVTKPLTSVGKVCDAGNECYFNSEGGWIYNCQTGTATWFPREVGVYMMHNWLWTGDPAENPKSGFSRQER